MHRAEHCEFSGAELVFFLGLCVDIQTTKGKPAGRRVRGPLVALLCGLWLGAGQILERRSRCTFSSDCMQAASMRAATGADSFSISLFLGDKDLGPAKWFFPA